MPLGIGSRFRPPVIIAPPQSNEGERIDFSGSQSHRLTSGYRCRPLCLPWETMEVADRTDVPLGIDIGSRRTAAQSIARSGAALAGTACESPLGPRPRATRSTVSDLWRRSSRSQDSDRDPAVMHTHVHACFTHTCLFRQFRLSSNRIGYFFSFYSYRTRPTPSSTPQTGHHSLNVNTVELRSSSQPRCRFATAVPSKDGLRHRETHL